MLPAFGLYTHIRNNRIRSVILLASFPLVLPLVLFCIVFARLSAIGQPNAFMLAANAALIVLAVVLGMTAIWLPIAYLLNQSIIDTATGARLLTRPEYSRLWNLLENLCISRGMMMPALRLIETNACNAFASGIRDGQYSITVTKGLLDALEPSELEAVLAHELTHIRNRDVQLLIVSTILVGVVPIVHSFAVRVLWIITTLLLQTYRGMFTLLPMAGAKTIVTISYKLLFWMLRSVIFVVGTIGHFFSILINLALSRRREYLADAGAVELTKSPDALISALRKVAGRSDIETSIPGIREMMFDNPHIMGVEGLLATHPPIEKRIEAIVRYCNVVGS